MKNNSVWVVHQAGLPLAWYSTHPTKGAADREARKMNKQMGAEFLQVSVQEYDDARIIKPMTVSKRGIVKQNPIGNIPNLTKRYQSVLLTLADLRADSDPGMFSEKERAALIAKFSQKAEDLREAINYYKAQKPAAENPLVRVKIKSPPQRPAGNDDLPSKRLMKRRKTTTKAPRGVWANPIDGPFTVLVLKPGKKTYQVFATIATKTAACKYATELSKDNPTWAVMVSDDDHSGNRDSDEESKRRGGAW